MYVSLAGLHAETKKKQVSKRKSGRARAGQSEAEAQQCRAAESRSDSHTGTRIHTKLSSLHQSIN